MLRVMNFNVVVTLPQTNTENEHEKNCSDPENTLSGRHRITQQKKNQKRGQIDFKTKLKESSTLILNGVLRESTQA